MIGVVSVESLEREERRDGSREVMRASEGRK